MNIALRSLVALSCSAALCAQDFTVAVPNQLMRKVGRLLPERSNAGAPFLATDGHIEFGSSATVRIIFLHEGALYRNSLGYFTYTENVDGSVTIDSADLLLRDASMPGVQNGFGYDLKDLSGAPRTFSAGEKLGFFLIADGENEATSLLDSWSFNYADGLGQVPSPDPVVNEQRGRGLYTSVPSINPEIAIGHDDKAKHSVLFKLPGIAGFLGGEDVVICSFEDLLRTQSDDDFNDMIFAVEVTPSSAIANTLYLHNPGDPDNDGVRGRNDAFPNDPERASVERIPSRGRHTIAFEDQYPQVGDADYNDAVFGYVFQLAKNADGDVKDIVMTVSLVARGASYDHSFGLHLPGLPSTATGTIRIERVISGESTSTVATARTVESLISAGTRRIEDLVESTTALLPPPSGLTFTNTLGTPAPGSAGRVRVHIEFDQAIPEAVLGRPPYDPFLYVANPFFPNTRVDIHLTGKSSFPDRPGYLGTESGERAFLDDNGFPWALELPLSWRYPMENVGVGSAFSRFDQWRTSNGETAQNWFKGPLFDSLVGPPMDTLITGRVWKIGIPGR